jgi:hypothetical protein
VADLLLPSVRERYDHIQTNQEDWGWFIWFRSGNVRLAIDIFTEDPDEGTFLVHLTSRVKRLLVFDTVTDTPELQELRSLVVSTLEARTGGNVGIRRLDRSYV